MTGELLAINVRAGVTPIPNEFHAIKDALDGGTLDWCSGYHVDLGAYIDDDGILKRLPFNLVASLMLGRCLFGPAVITSDQADGRGESKPPNEFARRAIRSCAAFWREVLTDAEMMGQDLRVFANPDSLPPPIIIDLPADWDGSIPWPPPTQKENP